jgi:hypothetical protein
MTTAFEPVTRGRLVLVPFNTYVTADHLQSVLGQASGIDPRSGLAHRECFGVAQVLNITRDGRMKRSLLLGRAGAFYVGTAARRFWVLPDTLTVSVDDLAAHLKVRAHGNVFVSADEARTFLRPFFQEVQP